MLLVATIEDILKNLETLENYRQSKNTVEQQFYRNLLGRGKWFVVYECQERILIGPSRFVGYAGNRMKAHNNNPDKNGRETNPAIERVVNSLKARNVTYSEVDAKFTALCTREGVIPKNQKRKYWYLNCDQKETPAPRPTSRYAAPSTKGVVYLLKSGPYYKIGKTVNLEQRLTQIGLQLPEPVEVVHKIETDDVSGIESYWHRRFGGKRANGEWFSLTEEDVKAFVSRSSM
jgi:hypothetical protein